MAKIKVNFADDDDVEVIRVRKVNNNLNKHFIGPVNAIRLGMKYAGRSSRHE